MPSFANGEARLKQVAAETERQAETVRADAVGDFMDQLLGTIAPELLLQGHQRPVREVLLSADRLASTALSSAPAAELKLRGQMSVAVSGRGPIAFGSGGILRPVDSHQAAASAGARRQTSMPRDAFRITTAISALWAGDARSRTGRAIGAAK